MNDQDKLRGALEAMLSKDMTHGREMWPEVQQARATLAALGGKGDKLMPHPLCSAKGCREKASTGSFSECDPYCCKLATQPEAQPDKSELHRQVAAVEALCAAGWTWNGSFWDFPTQPEAQPYAEGSVERDMMLYGTAFTVGGKRVDPREVFVHTQSEAQGEAVAYLPEERTREAIEVLREVTEDSGPIEDDVRMDHLTSVVRRVAAMATAAPKLVEGVFSPRYVMHGPEGMFGTDDLDFAEKLLQRGVDDADEWVCTDLHETAIEAEQEDAQQPKQQEEG